ncbi:MAG TPA: alpha/beta hydrolase domain-containing protein [Casimicrobiaceae bacterium]|nr:alpha/beta hydrolase domain-containing protein [Casimicrobiaceae bacterium]
MSIAYTPRNLRANISIGFLFLLVVLLTAATAFAGTVTGPITGGAHGWPFGAPSAAVDLAKYGYVEEEYFIEGTANSYAKVGTWTTDGVWTAAPSGSAFFRTRLLVVRPADPGKFNGTAVVEWLNVSASWDIADHFVSANEELLRGGYAWVGVSAQAVGVQLSPFSLKAWDPSRYGSLNHPGDAYAYDMFTQAGRAIQNPQGANPLHGLTVERVVAAGHSQSANGLATYVNAIDPLVEVYDGFLLHSRSVTALRLFPGDPGVVPTASVIRSDTTAPVMMLEDEWSVDVASAWLARQPDNPNFRLWEVAGTGHVDSYEDALVQAIVTRDLMFGPLPCAQPKNKAPLHYMVNSALNKLSAWVATGVPPAHAPSFIEFVNGAIVRDSHGNAKGGVRLSQLEVPTATLTGAGNAGPGSCPNGGVTTPFDAGTLASLYPTHYGYYDAVGKVDKANYIQGYLLYVDMLQDWVDASRASIGN